MGKLDIYSCSKPGCGWEWVEDEMESEHCNGCEERFCLECSDEMVDAYGAPDEKELDEGCGGASRMCVKCDPVALRKQEHADMLKAARELVTYFMVEKKDAYGTRLAENIVNRLREDK